MKNISLIVGARAKFYKSFSIIKFIKAELKYNVRLINTGQHYDDNMAGIFFKELKKLINLTSILMLVVGHMPNKLLKL